MSQQKILESAKALLQELPTLLPDESENYTQEIAAIIDQIESGTAYTTQLNAIIRRSEILKQWMNESQSGKSPQDITRSIVNLAGNMNAQPRKPEYQCPECNATKAELPQGRVPKCDAHPHATLQRISP
jgi:ssDNA-binding Zn-finger/Zn-ribbon topoisomerase 1